MGQCGAKPVEMQRRSTARRGSVWGDQPNLNSKVLYNVIKCTEANEQIQHLINDQTGKLTETKQKDSIKAEIDLKRVIRLIDEEDADLSYHKDGNNALHEATYKCNIQCVKLLLEKFDNAGIDEKNKNGLTPFSIALNMGKIELSLFLLEAGANAGECFYCICMAFGEVHEVNDDAIIEFIKVLKKSGLDQATITIQQKKLPMQTRMYIKVNSVPLYNYIMGKD